MVDEFIIFDDMQYTRRDWRNRNKKKKDGIKWLTIPVEVKGKYFQRINETKINVKHWVFPGSKIRLDVNTYVVST